MIVHALVSIRDYRQDTNLDAEFAFEATDKLIESLNRFVSFPARLEWDYQMTGGVDRVVEFDVRACRWVDDQRIVLLVDAGVSEDAKQLFVRIPGLPEVRGLFFTAPEMF
ncbi:hypothetical protein [Halorhabdus tiamatea]|uniref:hypothetical protein n=1 Tax=Halorhabdus tiamatea TaxID=430914 RepID=UPI0002122FA6|nr:hypothetical protein [Halorhabdus tiamatea]